VALDEVPYMLDLHLFLGRRPANIAPAGDDPQTSKEVYYGIMPQRLLDPEIETVRGLIRELSEVFDLHKTVNNAMKLYMKTRPAASHASASRAKPIHAGAKVHPELKILVSADERMQDDFVAHLRTFRPSTTILESKEGSGGHVAMAAKRAFHQRTIHEVKEVHATKRAKRESEGILDAAAPDEALMADGATLLFDDEEKPSKYRDSSFFIDYVPYGDDPRGEEGYALGGEQRVDDMVLDLVGEENRDFQKSRNVMKWDAKKKKYTVQSIGRDGKVTKTNEAGAKVKKDEEKKVGRSYKQWQEKTKRKIGRVGEEEDRKGGGMMEYRKIAGRRVQQQSGPEEVEDELKTKDQLVKAKMQQEKNKNKNSQGHKGGKAATALAGMKIKGRAKYSKGNHALKGAGISKPKGTPSAPMHGKNREKKKSSSSKVNLAKTKYGKGKEGRKSKGASSKPKGKK